MLLNYLKNILYVFVGIFISIIFVTILNYFSLLNGKVLNVISVVIMILALLVGGYLTGKKANKKGYLEGIKFGGIMIVLILLFNLLVFKNEFNLISILYYVVLLISSMVGGMVGMMRKG